jgi:hypothetical protein
MYETSEDLASEREAADLIQEAWRVTLRKLPISYGADWAIEKDNLIVGWGEFKRRKFDWGDFDSIMLSVRKVSDLLRLAEIEGKSFFFVQANDGLRYSQILATDRFRIGWGGRTCKTRDADDIEPVALLPIARFKVIPKS